MKDSNRTKKHSLKKRYKPEPPILEYADVLNSYFWIPIFITAYSGEADPRSGMLTHP